MIGIVDYGVGNVRAIANMLKAAGEESFIINSVAAFEQASKIILPGVGAFDTAMQSLQQKNFSPALHQKIIVEQCQVLGICLGMQLLMEGSEEGKEKGLGWIPGFAYRFPQLANLKVPHMQWNNVQNIQPCQLTEGINNRSKFYFVHSYFVKVKDSTHSLLQTNYGITFNSGVQKNHISGVQFHPERSHKYGLQILSNFARL